MRAVVEHHGALCDVFPPIKVVVALGREDLTIKVCYELFVIPMKITSLFHINYWTIHLLKSRISTIALYFHKIYI